MNTLIRIGLTTSLLITCSCSKKNVFQPPPPPEVSVQQPQKKDVTVYTSFPGQLAASDDVEIRARVKGFLKSIDFEDGQRVQKGALLFTIEPEEYIAAVKAEEARLSQAQAALKLADATLQRTEKAYQTRAVSEVDVLTAEANKQSAEAAVLGAQAALDNARLNLSYTELHAPFSGRLARRKLSIGNLVGSGEPTLLTTLVVESPIHVFFNVDERALLPYLQTGVRSSTPGGQIPPVRLELADGTLHDEIGIVDYIDPQVDPDTGTLRARALFENKEVKLLPGLYGKILVPDEIKSAILVPDLATLRDMGGSYVLIVNDENKVERRSITTGALVGKERIIQDGLSTEDRVIIGGVQRARPGIPVRITPPSAD